MSATPRTGDGSTPPGRRILYCHCAYAKVVPEPVKREVLKRLSASGVGFDAVADLCEMSARKDPALARLAAGGGPTVIAACFPRAVKWLFHSAGVPFDEAQVDVLNMREQGADEIVAGLLGERASETSETKS